MTIAIDEMSKNAMGGTEMMKLGLTDRVNPSLLEPFHITASRFRGVEANKIELYWLHDLPGDPESDHIAQGGWNKFDRLVFVSNWQMQNYQKHYGFPWYKAIVLQNAIDPIPLPKPKSKDKIKLIYHTTPHRGLELLVPAFERLAEKYDNVELDVFSSFEAYGWKERDKPYEELFQRCKDHPKINYHGYQPNDVVRKALAEAHIYAYPSIWLETSCISLMEAMSAGCVCVHPNYGALPETAANWTMMYQWTENKRDHVKTLYEHLNYAVEYFWDENIQEKLTGQKLYTDFFYGWSNRALQWEAFLASRLQEHGFEVKSIDQAAE